jgi:hypothetical protein
VTAAARAKCRSSPTRIGLSIVRRAGKNGSLDTKGKRLMLNLAAKTF